MSKRTHDWVFVSAAFFISAILLCTSSAVCLAAVTYDWDDGTLQGWTPEPPFGGTLGVSTGFGNPGGSMFATDTAVGGGLLARAPAELTGDLSIYQGIWWDEFVPDRGSNTISTFVLIQASDGSLYSGTQNVGIRDRWNQRFEPFDDPLAWDLIDGSGSIPFLDAIKDVEALYISMDTSGFSGGVLESYVDNVSTVPIPGAFLLLGSAIATLGLTFRSRDKDSIYN